MFIARTLAGAATGALMASSAFAADMPMYDKAPTIAAPVPQVFYDWTGVYAGVHAGYFWGEVDAASAAAPGAPFSYEQDGFLAGGQVGANWQFDRFVFGVEGDLSWSDVGGDTAPAAPVVSSEVNWSGTVRGRAGIAIDRILIYGTGGVAFADVESSVAAAGYGSTSETMVGWTAGAGIEAALTESITGKVEVLYTDYGDEGFSFAPATVDQELSGATVRAGLNYRFNFLR